MPVPEGLRGMLAKPGKWGWALGLAILGILYLALTAYNRLAGRMVERGPIPARDGRPPEPQMDAGTLDAGNRSQPDRVSAVGIAITAAVLLIGILALAVILWHAMGALGGDFRHPARSHILPTAGDSVWFAEFSLRPEPPFPLLQTHPAEDLRDFRAREDSLLAGYGWADSASGKVRIPVERAMEILASRGLSVQLGRDTLPANLPGTGKDIPP